MVARRVNAWSGLIVAITSPDRSRQKLRPIADSARTTRVSWELCTSNVRVKTLDFCAEATGSPTWSSVQCPLEMPCLLTLNDSPSAVIAPCSPIQLNFKVAWCPSPSRRKSHEQMPFGLQCIMVQSRAIAERSALTGRPSGEVDLENYVAGRSGARLEHWRKPRGLHSAYEDKVLVNSDSAVKRQRCTAKMGKRSTGISGPRRRSAVRLRRSHLSSLTCPVIVN